MNSCKSKILKSEAIRIIEKKVDSSPDGNGADGQGVLKSTETARERLHKAIGEAYERGVSEGMKKGRDLERRELAGALKAAEELVKHMNRLRASILERSADDILGLAFAIAEKVIHHEVAVNPHTVAGVLKMAVAAINEREHVRVRCNPRDLAVLEGLRPEFVGALDSMGGMEFVEDSSIAPGGVRIETEGGEVDARLDKQFDVIKDALLS